VSEGSLTVVGTGFMGAGHVTPEALAHMDTAQKLFYLGGDASQRRWLQDRNRSLESLYDAYRVGGDRRSAYAEMVARMLAPVRKGRRVCAAFYGHPGVFVYPSHEAIRQARAEGYAAAMLPGVSAEDCLFADLGVDPARAGCQSYEATYFLVRSPRFSPSSALILWQVGAVGVATFKTTPLWGAEGLQVLVDTLCRHYPADHEVVVYQAAIFPVCEPSIVRVPLSGVPQAGVTVHSTMYIPPLGAPPPDAAVMARLGLEARDVVSGAGDATAAGTGRMGKAPASARGGSLTVVGTGYHVAGQITAETQGHIEEADRVFFLLRDPLTAAYLRKLNPRTTSLHDCYREGRSGTAAREEMVERIVAGVRQGRRVCAAFYGHPAILAPASLEAIRRARGLGCEAQMLPGVSVADCLFADLGVDPGTRGCQLYEATDFLLRGRTVEDATPLILLQVGAVGVTAYRSRTEGNRAGFAVLIARLRTLYPDDHPVTLYEIPQMPTDDARIDTRPLSSVGDAPLTVYATLYVPPAREAAPSPEMVRRLKLAAPRPMARAGGARPSSSTPASTRRSPMARPWSR
jgi:uncharacterized protein YabN with tetrapyrrole methylase and pyrophosphatase domain